MSIEAMTNVTGRTASATTPSTVTGPTAGATAQTDPQMGSKDMFLKLLVAQLKYQNPMEPVDSSQFMAQTAQFTMVEKLQAMAAETDALVAGEASQRAAGLLERVVRRSVRISRLKNARRTSRPGIALRLAASAQRRAREQPSYRVHRGRRNRQ